MVKGLSMASSHAVTCWIWAVLPAPLGLSLFLSASVPENSKDCALCCIVLVGPNKRSGVFRIFFSSWSYGFVLRTIILTHQYWGMCTLRQIPLSNPSLSDKIMDHVWKLRQLNLSFSTRKPCIRALLSCFIQHASLKRQYFPFCWVHVFHLWILPASCLLQCSVTLSFLPP